LSQIDDVLFNLESPVDETRMQAIVMATRFSDPRVINALNNVAANDANVELRYHARRAVHQIKEKISSDVGAGSGTPGMGSESILAGLKNPSPEFRLKAVTALVGSDLAHKEDHLQGVVDGERDPQVRSGLATALIGLGARAIPFLAKLIEDPDPRVKANCIEAIEQIGDGEAYAHIVPYLADVDNRVRTNAAQALNRFGKTRLIKCLDRMIDSDKTAYRDSAIYALGVARMPEAVPLLERGLKDVSEAVRLKAVRALEVLSKQGVKEAETALGKYRAGGGEGEQTVEIALGDLFNRDTGLKVGTENLLFDDLPEHRVQELKKIIKLRVYERIDDIVNLLRREKDENVKATALIALGRLKAKKYIGLLKPYLKEKQSRIRASAVEALGAIEDPTLWIDLMPMLDDANNRVKANAIVALRKCPDVDLDQHLRAMLSHKEPMFKRSAMYALMELRDERYMDLFLKALDDPSPEIKKTAMEDIVILKAEGSKAAEELFQKALAKGLKPPEPSSITRRQADVDTSGSEVKTITVTREIDRLLVKMVEKGASDLHLSADHQPRIRKDGDIQLLDGFGKMEADALRKYLWPIMGDRNKREYEQTNDTDLAYEIADLARFRVNVFRDRFGMGAVFRQLPSKVPSVEKLQLPKQVVDLCHLPKGLVLVTGPTGSGKSTTLAALVGYINNHRSDHIITVEDPIEFVHPSRRCLVNQREVYMHTDSFKKALRAALREDPDIVLVGEMRDLETTQIAIETAETGHLVFGTLHTNTASSTVDRVINQFPKEQQEHIRLMIADSLKAVIAQTLAKKIGGGRVAIWEIMIVNAAIANLIREEKTFQIPSIIQTTRHLGNISLNDSLVEWMKAGVIDPKEAYFKSVDKLGFLDACKRLNIQVDLPSEELMKERGPNPSASQGRAGGMGGMGHP
jgi:twitching motility protein PilT